MINGWMQSSMLVLFSSSASLLLIYAMLCYAMLCYAMLHRQSRLGAYSAKGHFFQSLLCHLALGDTVQVK